MDVVLTLGLVVGGYLTTGVCVVAALALALNVGLDGEPGEPVDTVDTLAVGLAVALWPVVLAAAALLGLGHLVVLLLRRR